MFRMQCSEFGAISGRYKNYVWTTRLSLIRRTKSSSSNLLINIISSQFILIAAFVRRLLALSLVHVLLFLWKHRCRTVTLSVTLTLELQMTRLVTVVMCTKWLTRSFFDFPCLGYKCARDIDRRTDRETDRLQCAAQPRTWGPHNIRQSTQDRSHEYVLNTCEYAYMSNERRS